MTDYLLMDYLAQVSNKTIKERAMHIKGAGAYGAFRPYMSMSDYTKAAFLQDSEVVTPVFVRFSKMLGRGGSPDTERSPKGFSVKFFTTEGKYDLICQNMPVFFISEGKKLPELLEAFSPKKNTNLADNESFWNFFSKNPEAVNIVTWLYSDRGTTKSYRHLEGYSVNTYKWISKNGEEYYVRYKWSPMSGVKEISRNEAEFLCGFDPDIAAKELYEAIEEQQYPEYELSVQLVSVEHIDAYDFDLLNCTVAWSEKEIPTIKIGKMVLNRIPENYYEEVEKSGFNPLNLVSGIAFSEDKLLEIMSFAMSSGARSRGAWL